MRGGVYAEYIVIPHDKKGRDLDGQGGPDGGYKRFPEYWRIEKFKVTGGGIDDNGSGGGIVFRMALHITFRRLYVHDNDGNYNNNTSGIVVSNSSGRPQHIVVEHSFLIEE